MESSGRLEKQLHQRVPFSRSLGFRGLTWGRTIWPEVARTRSILFSARLPDSVVTRFPSYSLALLHVDAGVEGLLRLCVW